MEPIDPNQIELLDEEMVRILRTKSPEERLEMGLAMNEMARQMIAASLRDYHPDWNEEQIMAEVGRRMLDGAD